MGQSLDLNKSESSFPKDASLNKVGWKLKWVNWFVEMEKSSQEAAPSHVANIF